MGFTKKTIKDIDLKGKTVLLRADYNVPVRDDGSIADDYRISQSVPTIQYLLGQHCKVIICSHLGRPEGKPMPAYSLKPVAQRLGELLKQSVVFVPDCVGAETERTIKTLKAGDIALLENLRFHPEEEANDPSFAKQLAGLADVFAQDGFGVVHRAHASTDAVTQYVPSVAGLLLEKEVDTITRVMENPERPLMAIIGGAKISDKIAVLKKFIAIADFVAVGGAMANTFLLAKGIETGKSLAKPDDIPIAEEILELAQLKAKQDKFVFYLPQDGVVAAKLDSKTSTRVVDWTDHVLADIQNYPKTPPQTALHVGKDEMILDIGPMSGSFIAGSMQLARTVIWNGAMGVTETPAISDPIGPFAHGTEVIVEAMLGQYGTKPFSVVGGGDTVSYIEQRQLTDAFGHVSTGGGAGLELMAGKTLPGVAALMDKAP